MFIPPRTTSVFSPIRSKPLTEPLLNWSITRVAAWLSSIGFGSFEQSFLENSISGDILVKLTDGMLKELKVNKIGHRISILKAIYELKLLHSIAVEPGDYIPPSVEVGKTTVSPASDLKRNKRWSLFDSQTNTTDPQKLLTLVQTQADQISRLSLDLQSVHSEIDQLKKLVKDLEHAFLAVQSAGHTPASHYPRRPSVTLLHAPTGNASSGANGSTPLLLPQPPSADVRYVRVQWVRADAATTGTAGSSTAVPHTAWLEPDPVELLAVHRGEPASALIAAAILRFALRDTVLANYTLYVRYNAQDFTLGHDEAPFAIQVDMERACAEPVFVLKHVGTSATDLAASAGLAPPARVLDPARASPAPGKRNSVEHMNTASATPLAATAAAAVAAAAARFPLATEATHAVTVYEYTAQRSDEVSLMIGDALSIRCRQAGWCVVQKAAGGDAASAVGWVPTGCLMEERFGEDCAEDGLTALALFDYTPIGPNELAIKRGNALKLQKKYQHWFVAKLGKASGWVPSCYVSVIRKKNSFSKALTSPLIELRRKESLPNLTTHTTVGAAAAVAAAAAAAATTTAKQPSETTPSRTTNASNPPQVDADNVLDLYCPSPTHDVFYMTSSPTRKLNFTTHALSEHITHAFSKPPSLGTSSATLHSETASNPMLGQTLNLVHLLSQLPASHPKFNKTCDRLEALLSKLKNDPRASDLVAIHLQLTHIASVFKSNPNPAALPPPLQTSMATTEASVDSSIALLTAISTPQGPPSPFLALSRGASLHAKHTSPNAKAGSSSTLDATTSRSAGHKSSF